MKGRALFWVAFLGIIILTWGCSNKPVEQVAGEGAPGEEATEAKPMPGDVVTIPAGEFTMGTDNDLSRYKLAEPAHTVDLPAYQIDVYEVTNGQFVRFQLESDYKAQGDWRSYYTIGREDYPVANVTWDDAKAFCEWAGGRLPTEAEWEKAARGTEQLKYPWGPVFDWTKANTNEHGVRDTVEVGSIPTDKSPYGCYDMFGNLQEWTSEKLAPYPDAKQVDPKVFKRGLIALRGSSYALKGESMGLYSRTGAVADAQQGYGFRCVKDIAPATESQPSESK